MEEINSIELKKKIGRPKFWNETRVSDLAVRLEEWAEKATSYALVQFCAQENLQPNKLGKLAKENEDFWSALSRAKTTLASRMIENINKKDGCCHPIFFSRYIRANDYFLDQFMKEQEKTESSDTANHLVKIIDFSSLKNERDLKKEKDNTCN